MRLPRFENILRPHQIEPARQAYRALMRGDAEWGYPGAVDLSDVGTGKSFVDLAAMANVRPKVVVLTPVAGIPGWQGVFKAFGIEPHFIGSHQAVRGGWRAEIGSLGERFFHWQNSDQIGIVLDEAHMANGIDTQMMACIGGAINQRVPIIAGSASLAMSPLHLRIAGRITGLHKGGKDWWVWLARNGCQIDTSSGEERWVWRCNQAEKQAILRQIHSLLIPARGCRMRKADMGDQPGSTISTLPLEVDGGEAINQAWRDLDAKLDTMKRNKLPAGVIEGYRRKHRSKLWQLSEEALVPAVAKRAKEALAAHKSVVVFCNFTATRLAMMRLLGTNDGLYGGMSPKRRTDVIAAFQANRIHVLVNNISSGGASASLHDIHGERPRESFIFPTDKWTLLQQAPGRIDRFGGKSHSLQWLPCIKGGMHEIMIQSTQRKLSQLAIFNDGINAYQ